METNGGAGDWKSRLTGKKRMITRLPLGSVKYKVILRNISFLLKPKSYLSYIENVVDWFLVVRASATYICGRISISTIL